MQVEKSTILILKKMRKTDYVSINNAIMLEHFGYKPEKGEIDNLMVYRYETVINPEIEKLYPNETG